MGPSRRRDDGGARVTSLVMSEMSGATAGHGGFRASDGDREQAIDRLKTAFADGLLAEDEFELRVGRALVSRTHADLAEVTADLPGPGVPTGVPASSAAAKPVRRPRDPSVKAAAAIVGTPLLAAVTAAIAFGSDEAAVFIVFVLLLAASASAVVATVVRTMLLLEARQAQRSQGSGGPSPPSLTEHRHVSRHVRPG